MTYFKRRRIKEGFHHIFQRRRKLLLCLLVIREGFHTVQEGLPLENSKKDQRREKDQRRKLSHPQIVSVLLQNWEDLTLAELFCSASLQESGMGWLFKGLKKSF